jgi:methionine-rich copper-binding protein CopC
MLSVKSALSVLLIATAAAASGSALAHATLKQASPSAGTALDAPPKEVVLVFNEKLEGSFSSIKVLDPAGKDVATAKASVDPSDATKLRLGVPPLASGTYTVRWSTVGPDGHPRKGDYTFTVK